MLLVNYYPGSLGDTIIHKLTALPQWVDYVGSVKLDYPWNLKTVAFYKSSFEQKRHVFNSIIKPWLKNNQVIGAHRFEQFDFQTLDNNIKVLSIDPRQCLDLVAPLFMQKVQKVVGYYDSTVQQLDQVLIKRYGENHKIRIDLAKKQITKWCENNILPTDTVINLKLYLDDSSYIDQYKQLVHA